MHIFLHFKSTEKRKGDLLRVTLIKRWHVIYHHEQRYLHQWPWKVLTNLCCNTQKPVVCPICNLPTCSLWTVSNVYSVEETLHQYSPLSEAWRFFNIKKKSLQFLSSLFPENWGSLIVVSCEEFRCQSKIEDAPFTTLDQETWKSWFSREKLRLVVHQREIESLSFFQWLPTKRNKQESSKDQTFGWIL